MTNAKKILFIAILIFFIPILVHAAKPLEVDYPFISSEKETTDLPLPYYIKYFLKIVVASAGIIAFGALVVTSLRYLSSAGNTEKMKAARQGLLSALVGVLILLGSYIILNTINPNLTEINIADIPEAPPSEPVPHPSPEPGPSRDILGRVRRLIEEIRPLPETVKNTAEEINSLTNQCDCQNTFPVCMCDDGAKGSSCVARVCSPGDGFHPCPKPQEIKNLQKKITKERDLLLYYRNRVLSEIEDLSLDIKFLEEKVEWYNKEIEKYEDLVSQNPAETNKAALENLKEIRGILKVEINYKQQLGVRLKELSDIISQTEEPVTEIAFLPEECFSQVQEKCTPTCKTGRNYGCHDKVLGCQPDKCTGGNPCPMNKIKDRTGEISSFPSPITKKCNEVISIINNI